MQTVKSAFGFGTALVASRKVLNTLKGMTKESIDFVETQNLFNVSMGKGVNGLNKYYQKAISFQEKLEEKLGINIAESTEYQALFNSMSKSMGISAKYAYILSENFTKLGHDISSLYNIDPQNAMQKLRAGLAGQTKPLRDLGLDITQQSLVPIAKELGIEKSIKKMSQAEKMILRYIAVLKQAKLAQGDFAKTMDTPANQLRIFNAQITAFKRNMGNLWQGLLGNILPYINATMMVINELLKMLSKLFGFESSGIDATSDLGIDDLSDDLESATGNAKKLKQQLMGFDEIHNIDISKTKGSGSDTGIGIDQRLLDAMKEYDNLMDKVRGKATDIRDKMMEWLGFHRTVDGWTLNDELTNAEKILDIVKMIGVALGTWKVSSGITELLKNLGVLNSTQAFQIAFGLTLTLTGIYAQYKGTSHILNGDADLFTILETLLGTAGGAFGIANILKATSLGKTLGFGKSLLVGLGRTLAIQGIQVLSNGIENNDIQKKIVGALEMGLGAGLTVATFSGNIVAGLVVGVTITTLIGLASLIQDNDEYSESIRRLNEKIIDNAKAVEDNKTSWDNKKKAIQDNLDVELAEIGHTEKLADELKKLVDSNGKVKSGYEDRVKYILNEVNSAFNTEYELVDGQITKNGELVDSYDEIRESIAKKIEAMKAEAIAEANQEMYVEAIKNQTKYYKERKEAIDNNKEAENNLSEALAKVGLTMEDYTRDGNKLFSSYNAQINSAGTEIREEIQKATSQYEISKKTLEDASQNWKESTEIIVAQEDLKTAIITGDSEKIQKAIRESTNTYETETGKQTLTLAEEIEKESAIRQTSIDYIKSQNKELTEELKTSLDTQLLNLAENLRNQTNTVETLTPEIMGAWKSLAENAEDAYNAEISNVNEDTRLAIEAATNTTGKLTAEQVQSWADLAIKNKEAYDKNLSGLDTTTSERIQSCVDAINNKKWTAEETAIGLAQAVENGVNTIDTSEAGRQAVNGVASGINQNKNGWSLTNAITNLKNKIVDSLKEKLGIHSPSTVMRDMIGKFIPLGIAKGIDKESSSVYSSIDKLNKGIEIHSKDFEIDTNEYIDYGKINGAIATQVNIGNSMSEQVYSAVVAGMKNVKIPIEIEARTDEGVIFKKVQVKASEFATQTGENPFPVLI